MQTKEFNPRVELLKRHHITQSLLASELGVSRQAMSVTIRGDRRTTIPHMRRIYDGMRNLGADVSFTEVVMAFASAYADEFDEETGEVTRKTLHQTQGTK